MVIIITVFESAFYAVVFVFAHGSVSAGCRSACRSVPIIGIFCAAINAKIIVNVSKRILGNFEFVFMFAIFGVNSAADVASRAEITVCFAAVMRFFYGFAVFAYLDFAATAFFIMISDIFFVIFPHEIMCTVGIAHVAANRTNLCATAFKIVLFILRALVENRCDSETFGVGASRSAVIFVIDYF